MKSLFLILVTYFCILTTSECQKVIPVKNKTNITISFGSCFHQRRRGDTPAQIFYRIVETKPDLWVWLGDVAYLDTRLFPMYFYFSGEEYVKEELAKMKEFQEYILLRVTTPIIGIWDDHDYGINNGNKNFKHKRFMQRQFLNFLDEPSQSPRREREGIYESYYIGDPTKIKVILLDVRYFRDTPSEGIDMLGETQWVWLENELRNNTAEYVIIGVGTPFLPDDRIFTEKWYSWSREKLLSLIRKYKMSKVIFISGDPHFAEIMRYPCKERVGYHLYEITSSGMTHAAPTFFHPFVKAMYPDTYNTKNERFLDKNFGLFRFSFEGNTSSIAVEIRDENGKVVLSKTFAPKELVFDKNMIDLNKSCILDERPLDRFYKKQLYNLRNPSEDSVQMFKNAGLALFIIVTVLVLVIILLIKSIKWGIRRVKSHHQKEKKE
jgi:Phosphodiesterase/alkaline phosphatase D